MGEGKVGDRLRVQALNIPFSWLNTTDRMIQQWLLRQQRWYTSCDLLCLLPWHLCHSKYCEVGLSSVAMTADMMAHEVNQQWCFWQTDRWTDREAVQTENLIQSKLHNRKARLYLMCSKLGIILFKLQYKWQNLATLMKILNHLWNENCAKPVLPSFTRRGHGSLKSQNSSSC